MAHKDHFIALDGLRGVASLMVVVFHLFEAYSGGSPHKQIINHGYLAVDFFFLLFIFAQAGKMNNNKDHYNKQQQEYDIDELGNDRKIIRLCIFLFHLPLKN